jgi:hypothetical protein
MKMQKKRRIFVLPGLGGGGEISSRTPKLDPQVGSDLRVDPGT